jgi:hypothetical protein
MTEQELRTLVRQAIARHAATQSSTSGVGRVLLDPPTWSSDPAHAMFILPSGADADGPCIIEPAVMCNHCGYCKSLGH